MTRSYTGSYKRIPSGYMGQLADWPEVVTEGKTLAQCREMLEDALREMIAAYRQQGKELRARTVPVKRHRTIDRITANELCKQAGLTPKF